MDDTLFTLFQLKISYTLVNYKRKSNTKWTHSLHRGCNALNNATIDLFMATPLPFLEISKPKAQANH